MTSPFPAARDLSAYHDRCLADPSAPAPSIDDPLWQAIARNHRCNRGLWDEEDQARRTDVADSAIAANKRAIDRFNQERNDATETADEIILAALIDITQSADCRLNSETAGSMIDRLSILSLKIHHMRAQAERSDADEAHRTRCRERGEILSTQRVDLQSCLDTLLEEACQGRARFRIYRQFKMYNDPSLNPYLYRSARSVAP